MMTNYEINLHGEKPVEFCKFSLNMGLDYYGILGVNRSASDSDIKKAYRRLALKYHPQRSDLPDAEIEFTLIGEAYDVLAHPKTKALYDQFGEENIKIRIPQPFAEKSAPYEKYTYHGDPYKTFREFFGVDNPFSELYLPNVEVCGKFVGDEGRSKKFWGESTEHTIQITLKEAFYGCQKKVTRLQRVLDETGSKTVPKEKVYTINIPPGCPDNRRFLFRHAGDQGVNSIPGDVTFITEILPDPTFQRDGNDLILKKSVPLAHALTGCVIDVVTFDGKKLHIPLTSVVKPTDKITLSEEGMPIENTRHRGDLIVEFQVEFPERMSQRQKSLVRKALLQ